MSTVTDFDFLIRGALSSLMLGLHPCTEVTVDYLYGPLPKYDEGPLLRVVLLSKLCVLDLYDTS